MPEGPEVRREADQIGEVLINQRLTEVFFGPTPLKRHRKSLLNATVQSVTTKGKALLIFFDTGSVLYSHHQL